ncbi:BON domain-containing protein [Massilia sp. GCM10023247]|uniref:BON domain-containing protein n=1 Tax=Massilia sp. GCM10023247 TaxID=3252643 RepID=UPI00361E6B21
MKSLLATLLATAAGASFAAAPTAALNHDAATYRNVTQKAATEYKAATAKCDAKSGNDKDICMAEAKAARARSESQAIAKYNNSEQGRANARAKVAEAEYDVAKEKCDDKSGAEKDSCLDNAKSVRTAALADAKAGRTSATAGANAAADSDGLIASTDTKDPAKAAAVAKCEQVAGSDTACLVDNKGKATALANRADNATERAADKTRDGAETVVDKTKAAAATVVAKTREMASNVGDKTREVAADAREESKDAVAKTDNAAERAGDKTRDAGRATATAASDTAITTKVKASLFKEPELKSMAINVETEKGVVMLSGFVESKAEADKAVKAAREVDGVTSVKNNIKVK